MRNLTILLLLLAAVPAYARVRVQNWCQDGNKTITVLGYTSSTSMPVQRSYPGCTVAVYITGGAVGTVSTSGAAVTWESGTYFNSNGQWPGLSITINSVAYTIASVSSATSLMLTTSAGRQTKVAYSAQGALAALYSDNNGTAMSNPFTASVSGLYYFYVDNGRYDLTFSRSNISSAFTLGDNPAFDQLWDFEFSSLSAGCSASNASQIPLAITKSWLQLPTQTISCNLIFHGGLLQPASGQTVTLRCPVAPNRQIFDPSQGGTIAFSESCGSTAPLQWWGGTPDWNGSSGTDNLPALNAATATLQTAGIPLYIPPGSYYVSASWTISPISISGWEVYGQIGNIAGSSRLRGSWLVFGTGGIVESNTYRYSLHDFGIQALVKAGPNFSFTNTAGQDSLRRMTFISSNPAQALVRATNGTPSAQGDMSSDVLEENKYYAAPSFTVPQVWFTNTAGGALMALNRISGNGTGQFIGTKGSTAPFIKIDCGPFTGCNGWRIENILTEVCPAGSIELDGISNSSLENIAVADPGTMIAPSLLIDSTALQDIDDLSLDRLTILDGSPTIPSVLINIASGTYTHSPHITASGGIIAYTRITGAGWDGRTLPKFTNVHTYDIIGISADNTDTSFYPYSEIFASRLLSSVGSIGLGQDPSKVYSPASGGCLAASDLTVDISNPYLVTSASHTFNYYDRYIAVTGGTGWTVGLYPIVKNLGSAALLAKSPAATGTKGGQYILNQFELAAQQLQTKTSNVSMCTYNAVTGSWGWNPVLLNTPQLTAVATNALPACNSTSSGLEMIVYDANNPTYLGALVGGGGTFAPVVCRGSISTWITY